MKMSEFITILESSIKQYGDHTLNLTMDKQGENLEIDPSKKIFAWSGEDSFVSIPIKNNNHEKLYIC